MFSAPLLLVLLSLAIATKIDSGRSTRTPDGCRTIPGDSSWPGPSQWDQFNQTVGGKLIATVPIAAPCHNTLFGQPSGVYNQDKCDALRNTWYYPTTHLLSSSSPMAYTFSNNSCNPFLGPDTPCTIGGYVVFTVNATSSEDFQATVEFAKKKNIRLVIRNSGHDYLGKSTGAHALGLWTHNLKSMELIQTYQNNNTYYNGPAIRLGAGVRTIEAYEFANSHGYVVVGGNCPTVGLAGGYIQGGGHGPLSSMFGLAADQVLEYELVTADGRLVTATRTSHSDLFWALRGGGGSTFGIVVSVVVKAFPDSSFSTAYMMISNNGTNEEALYSAVGTFIQTLPSLVDAGAIAIWVVIPEGFYVTPVIYPGIQSAELDAKLAPVTDSLQRLGLTYTYSSSSYPTFLTTFNSVTTVSNVSDQNIGGRLIPRSLVEGNDITQLVDSIRYISTQDGGVFVGNAINVRGGVASPDDVAANPHFRDTLFSATIGTTIDYLNWDTTLAAKQTITDDLLPRLEALTPGGGAYLNEGDVNQPEFQSTFFGDHYDRLLQIKREYDPCGIFYAETAVGSESWVQDINGRLCRA
ncbi:hypothetical protein INS49_003223 [Diaporthe citri]|uniref:uncharacterized protein n=1 Tax=Diaporthe citri TaxID=83186 RepID=UPI001C7FA704|nr:uncharacterized protein INS49_003223 [Diaporthe citri]KAG6369004.1 hypothetical protein INS49_003223 [Diaporthe citri]